MLVIDKNTNKVRIKLLLLKTKRILNVTELYFFYLITYLQTLRIYKSAEIHLTTRRKHPRGHAI